MARNINILGSIRVFVTGACEDITFINCSGQTGTTAQNGWTIINDGRYIPNRWDEPSVSSTITVDGERNVYLVDTTLGDATFLWDIVALEGCAVTLKVIAGANNIIISTLNNTENFEFAALPYTITPSIGDSYTIFSNGVDLFII